MGLFSFIKEAGEKLFGKDTPEEIQAKIQEHIAKQGLGISELSVIYDATNEKVTLRGYAPNQDAYEKAVLAAGNVDGVASVENLMKLPHQVAAEAAQAAVAASQAIASATNIQQEAQAATESKTQYHDVVRGDTLSGIAKKYYGDANQYNKIFEANKPMLSHPDKIYVGQKLRIPE
ncbi:LysM and BON domain-containing protein [Neisseriaceae bacterium B1]